MNPDDILRPELWLQLFDKAENAQDWFSVTLFQESISFKEVPSRRRARALFPLTFPQFSKYLGFQDLLALRLVSRRWRKTVDWQMNSVSPKTLAECHSKYDFEDPATLIAFLKRFYSHPPGKSPIIGNSIVIDYTGCRMAGNMMQAKLLTSCVMAKFGTHLTALEISDFTVGLSSWDNFAHRLRLVLKQTPRLSWLTITCNTFAAMDTDNIGTVVPFTAADASPVISNLKSLSFSALGRGGAGTTFVVGLQNAILRLCSGSSNSLRNVVTRGIPEALLDFPNLKTAIFSINGESCRSILTSASWPLLKLSLVASSNCDWDTRSFFEYAERFKGTLTSLVIFTNVTTSKKRSRFRVDLPQLKYLRLGETLPFDAFANLSNLEVLCITAVITHPGGLKGFMRDVRAEMLRSKIFQRLPSLRIVEMRGCQTGRVLGVVDSFHKYYTRENHANTNCEAQCQCRQ